MARKHLSGTPTRQRAAMSVDIQDLELKLIRRAAGLELDLLPLQELWTEEQYLKLTDQTNQLIEFTDGYTVLTLDGNDYAENGIFRRGVSAGSAQLAGFAVQIDKVFDAS
jgi:hypothetical protein